MNAANQPHILIVDDDKRLRSLISQFLRDNGFITASVESAEQARAALAEMEFDLIILDVMIPKENGHEFLDKLRKTSDMPVLMLTALGETHDRIKGLQHGADDYVTKPFEPQELLLRIQSVLRRTIKTSASSYKFAEFSYDKKTQTLLQGSTPVYLTSSEADLLTILCEQDGKVISREDLANKIGVNNDRAVDVSVMRLRKKIEQDPKKPIVIQTIRGDGYRFNLG